MEIVIEGLSFPPFVKGEADEGGRGIFNVSLWQVKSWVLGKDENCACANREIGFIIKNLIFKTGGGFS